MASGTYPIKGLPVPTGGPIPQREEITAWRNNPKNAIKVSLFIQALNIFQTMDPDDKLSYYQVAGIHGLPAQSWDTDPAPNKKKKLPINSTPQFYCPHGSLIFPTWHRAYLALFEQLLNGIMQEQILPTIADNVVREVWALEAQNWRMPYWDWAAPQEYIQSCGVPEIVSQPDINIISTGGALQTVPNPLVQVPNFRHHRYGITNKKTPTPQEALGVENNGLVANALEIPQWVKMEQETGKKLDPDMKGSLQDQVHRLLTQGYFANYATFATTEYGDNDLNPLLLPAGRLSSSSTTAFMSGPVESTLAQLHHYNVDRQLAIFQKLNPEHWLDGGSPTKDETADGPLHPFHSDTNATLITSNLVKDITSYGYTYDNLNVPVDDLKKAINEKYGSLRKHLNKNPDLDGRTNDYLINVQYDRFALNGKSYAVHFFLKGEIPSEPSKYRASPSHIGSIHTFSTDYWTAGNRNGVDCQNCQSQQEKGVKAKAQIPITLELLFRAVSRDDLWSDLRNLESDHVQQYLEQHLKWVIVAVPGEVIPTENLPGLKVVVHAGKGHHPEDTTQPSKFHSYRPMWSVTHGKTGGARHEDNVVHPDELQG
ncbi:hypothetical protein CFIO01_12464 [Colletotrichum fioriniae PJ7]|uniref:tyrosinase n=1 Tax=Colletotrichum fioriniae PJ7 TaxID=1445577 RepID=A0A010RR72_9PEZI|nr:hypothetical protein CFIO01_12464 [Colletotrichum fioriniae PJ7]